MNRTAFFNAIRPAFGQLSDRQIEGMTHLLDAGESLPLHHMAHVLAHVRRETGGYMFPIKETVMPHHKDKNPSDATVIARLDKAFKAGKLPWVKTPYWRDGWFGRGQIQLTHKANYAKFGISNPSDAMRPHISAHIAVRGMSYGLFTGRKLADYDFPAALDAPPSKHPRRIVNGVDGSDKEVSRFHREFAAALEAAGWAHVNERPETLTRSAPHVKKPAFGIGALVAAIMAGLGLWLADLFEPIRNLFGG